MRLAHIIDEYYDQFLASHEDKTLPGQIKALNAMRSCRTLQAGRIYVACPKCNHTQWHPLSCGNRNCPHCQHHENSQWINRQQNKILPVQYFMVTFTIPFEFRSVTYHHQREVYTLMFSCISSTLKDFGLTPKQLGAQIGMTMVLHTHSRRLDYHPHIHVIIPGGGIDPSRRQWKKKKGKYLFNQEALGKVFRGRFLHGFNQAGLSIPKGAPSKWVAKCINVGTGIPALKYLARYLYRGVINERNIISNKNGQVTFRYTESKTGKPDHRTLKGEDFLRLILQHVLPTGLRRARDYGFLHGNAKKLLLIVQLIFHVQTAIIKCHPKPPFRCPHCKSHMTVIGVCTAWDSG